MYLKSDKVLLVLAGSDSSGGMYNYLLCWINELETNDIEFAVAATKKVIRQLNSKCEKYELPYSFIECSAADVYRELAIHNVINNSAFETNLNQFKPTHIHFVDDTLYLPFFKNVLVNKKLKTIITVHDPVYHAGQFKNILTRLVAFYGRLFYFFIPDLYIHLHSSNGLFLSLPWFISKKIVHKHPLPKRLVSIVSREQGVKSIKIAFLGRIEPYKGIDLFIESLEKYDAKFGLDFFEISIIGRGTFDAKRFKNLRCKTIVIDTFVSDLEFHSHMNNQDVVALPYLNATQSGVGYMAKAYNKKIVCTPAGNLKDLVCSKEEGVISKDISSDSFMLAIRKVVMTIC